MGYSTGYYYYCCCCYYYLLMYRDLLIEQLMREIVELKDRIRELEEQNVANLELLGAIRTQMEEVIN